MRGEIEALDQHVGARFALDFCAMPGKVNPPIQSMICVTVAESIDVEFLRAETDHAACLAVVLHRVDAEDS